MLFLACSPQRLLPTTILSTIRVGICLMTYSSMLAVNFSYGASASLHTPAGHLEFLLNKMLVQSSVPQPILIAFQLLCFQSVGILRRALCIGITAKHCSTTSLRTLVILSFTTHDSFCQGQGCSSSLGNSRLANKGIFYTKVRLILNFQSIFLS